MGFDRTPKTATLVIHDYSSASIQPFASLKNTLKRILNKKPDYRLFQNQYVYNCFGFDDNIPYGFRDVGIDAGLLKYNPQKEKQYDFIYVGEMQNREINKLFELFISGSLSGKSVLFLSKNYKHIAFRLKNHSNIHFAGPVPFEKVKEYISASRYGLNFVPDVPPFNRQTSTKLLEYAAAKIPIITTDYTWVREFEKKYGGSFFYLNNDLSNFTWDYINRFQYAFPDLSEWTWEKQIRKSGVLEFLSSKFPELKW